MSRMKDLFGDTLFDDPAARHTDPITSHQAASRKKITAGSDRAHALIVHARHPHGLTDFELADILQRQQTSAGKRRGELRDAGLIEETEYRRNAPSGSPSIVWRITEAGKKFAEGLSW